ncbi:Rieske 2Fe-2S domain-containing protein [Anabaena azotica]|uniref:aromatic ring-hydroxylating dioxygenase subunit alpha n=1 Tax=Anabaena azotica TaxID=197653 RepID=UPI0039A5E518
MENQFSWIQQWYPLIPISYLDSQQPTSVNLLGKKLVIWRDNHQNWVVMDDACPHKLARLSLGKINADGNLMCRHHGWCFNSEGKCTKIPMLAGSEAEETACKSERSQITTYPTKVAQNLLWVWPDHSVTAFTDCTSKQPATIPETELDIDAIDWYMFEAPVGYIVSVESSLDPSHAQFLHEGIGSFSPEKTVPIQQFENVGEITSQGGFTLQHSGYNVSNKEMEATRKFTPPSANTTIYKYANGKSNLFQLYFVPTKPGYCRYIVKFLVGGNSGSKNLFFNLLPQYLQTGLKHISGYKLADQDLAMMHSQETIESSLQKPWNKAYFMPAKSDVGIVTFRKWLDEFAGGSPAWEEDIKTSFQELDDQQLFDRWHRHTKHCPSCRNSLLFIEKAQRICTNSIVVFAVLALLLILINVPVELAVLSTVIAVVSCLAFYLLDDLRHRFLSSVSKRGIPWLKLYDN